MNNERVPIYNLVVNANNDDQISYMSILLTNWLAALKVIIRRKMAAFRF
jgi:hypothetical protein